MSSKAYVPPFQPHPLQQKMIEACLVYGTVIWAVGRRWGKTLGAEGLLWVEAARTPGVYKAAYCSPTYKRATEVYRDFVQRFKPLIKKSRQTDLYVELQPFGVNKGCRIWFWSLEAHDNLRGEGVHRVIVDECADVVPAAYYATLMPMLADYGGKALLIGTPKRVGVGFVWFRGEFTKGKDEAFPRHFSGHGPSEGNPYLSKEVLADLRENCIDDLTRREEYDAEWIDEEGAVFERLDDAFVLDVNRKEGKHVWIGQPPREGIKYVMGLDLAQFEDFTVASIFAKDTGHQAALLRIQGENYDYQLEIIHRLRERYNNALIVADETGVGAPVVEKLHRTYHTGVVGRKWSITNKEEDITRGRHMFQDGAWKFLNIEWQRGEFQTYTREKLEASGRWRYTAAPGMHDDSVAAGCLASLQLSYGQRTPGPGKVQVPHFSIQNLELLEKKAKWRRYMRGL